MLPPPGILRPGKAETHGAGTTATTQEWRRRPLEPHFAQQARETEVIALRVTLCYPVGRLTFPGSHQQGMTLHPLLQQGN